MTTELLAATGKGQFLSLHPTLPAAYSYHLPWTSSGTFLDIPVSCFNALNPSETDAVEGGERQQMLFCQFSKPICPFAELHARGGANYSTAETGGKKRRDHPFQQQRLVRSAEMSGQRNLWPVTTHSIAGDIKTQHWELEGKAKRGHVGRD